MNSVYKEPTVYKQGLDEKDVENIVSNSEWVDVAGKIGTILAPSPSNVQIFYNSILSLIYCRGYFTFSTTNNGITPCYQFNNDLPGIDVTTGPLALFYYDSICYTGSYKCGLLRILPYDYPNNNIKKKITVDGSGFQEANFSGMFRFNYALKNQFEQYLDSH